MTSHPDEIPDATSSNPLAATLARLADTGGSVVFDLDSTLLDNRPRQAQILRDFAQQVGEPSFAAVAASDFDGWDLRRALDHAGVPRPVISARYGEARRFWQERFFTSAYCRHDQSIPGAVKFVNEVARAGRVIYLTGRPPAMRDGTLESLGRLGFPRPGDGETQLLLKPESALTFTKVDETLKKIATFLPVSDEMLEDYAQIQSYIDSRLQLFVRLQKEIQLLRGDGTGTNLVGLLNRVGLAPPVVKGNATPPTGSSTGSYLSPTTDNDMDAIYRQITQVRVTSFLEPDAVVIDPAGWMTIQLSKNTQGTYYATGPFIAVGASPSLWGKPVVPTTAMPAGTALVGAFGAATQVFNKGGLTVEASNSHADFFQRNLTAIRAETRCLLAVYRPGALGAVTGL